MKERGNQIDALTAPRLLLKTAVPPTCYCSGICFYGYFALPFFTRFTKCRAARGGTKGSLGISLQNIGKGRENAGENIYLFKNELQVN